MLEKTASRKARNWTTLRPKEPLHEKQRERLAKRRQRARLILLAGTIVFSLCVAGGIIAATHMSALRIARVSVSGNVAIPTELIDKHIDAYMALLSRGVFAKANAFLFPHEAFEASVVGSFPRIESAHATIDGVIEPTLTLTVQERTAYARWCRGDACFLMDAAGFVFAYDAGEERTLATDFFGLLTTEAVIGRVYAPGQFEQLTLLTTAFAQRGLAASRAELVRENVHFMLERGFEVRVPLLGNPEVLASTLDVALASEALRGKSGKLEYVDMRFGNRVYYKFQGEPAPTIAPDAAGVVAE